MSESVIAAILKDLRRIELPWREVDVDERNQLISEWRQRIRAELDAELQRHKRAIEWLIRNATDIPDSAWSAVPSDIADLVKGEK